MSELSRPSAQFGEILDVPSTDNPMLLSGFRYVAPKRVLSDFPDAPTQVTQLDIDIFCDGCEFNDREVGCIEAGFNNQIFYTAVGQCALACVNGCFGQMTDSGFTPHRIL